jgi:hypothetical protein
MFYPIESKVLALLGPPRLAQQDLRLREFEHPSKLVYNSNIYGIEYI